MKMIKGFETDVVRCEVGLGNNEHEILRRFETQEEAEKVYYWVKGLLESNNVEIYEDKE